MKKNYCFYQDKKYSGLIKLLKIMKLTVILLLVSVSGVFASKSYAQSKMLSVNLREATVKEVLNNIEEQSEFVFLYSENLIDVERKVNVTIQNKKVEQILSSLFNDVDVDYSIRDRFIVLTTPEVSKGKLELLQQQKSVTGTVTDESGEPLPGVTVLVKGTTQGTVTNMDGYYTISNVPKDATLQFSFVGMITREVEIGSQATVDITMNADAIGIEEVVAVGYGTQKKINLTGAISQVKSADFIEERPVTSVGQALQGVIPGLTVSKSNGIPGEGHSYNIAD